MESVKKYRVSGSIHKYDSLETDSIEEAIAFAEGLVRDGYASVVISDTNGEDW